MPTRSPKVWAGSWCRQLGFEHTNTHFIHSEIIHLLHRAIGVAAPREDHSDTHNTGGFNMGKKKLGGSSKSMTTK
jgi:hypothetical protein